MFGLRDLLLLAPSSTSLDISQPIFSHHLNNTTTTTTTTTTTNNNNNNTVGVGVGVIPLLPATYLEDTNFDGNSGETRMKLWSQSHQQAQRTNQNQQSQQQHHKRPMDNSGGSGAFVPIFINNSGSSNNSNNTSCSISGIACQDCGNQAKKDCSYRRCRTCCKSRAFDCSTHIKSTWVPASRRRERQQQQQQQHQEQNQEQSQLFTKKQRTSQTTSHTSTSGTRSFDSTQQDSPLPGQVRAPAVFKCVRVTSIDDGDDEFAYQATVKIGGRVFKGFLYDQGVDGGGEGIPNLSDLHLGAAVSSSSSPPVIDPSSHVYGGGMMGGSGYENQMN